MRARRKRQEIAVFFWIDFIAKARAGEKDIICRAKIGSDKGDPGYKETAKVCLNICVYESSGDSSRTVTPLGVNYLPRQCNTIEFDMLYSFAGKNERWSAERSQFLFQQCLAGFRVFPPVERSGFVVSSEHFFLSLQGRPPRRSEVFSPRIRKAYSGCPRPLSLCSLPRRCSPNWALPSSGRGPT